MITVKVEKKKKIIYNDWSKCERTTYQEAYTYLQKNKTKLKSWQKVAFKKQTNCQNVMVQFP